MDKTEEGGGGGERHLEGGGPAGGCGDVWALVLSGGAAFEGDESDRGGGGERGDELDDVVGENATEGLEGGALVGGVG